MTLFQNMVEHIVVPQIQHLLVRYVQDQEAYCSSATGTGISH